MNASLEKRTIPFENPMSKKDIKTFLSYLSDDVFYGMINFGHIIKKVDEPVQNECSGTIICEDVKINYEIHIHGDLVRRVQLSYPSAIDKEILNIVERKITEFFLAYPTNIS